MIIDTANLTAHWKTSANGVLSFLIATCIVLQGLGSPLISAKVNAGITLTLALCRAWVGFLQQDAGKTVAQTAAGEVKAVDSHELPNDPTSQVKP